MIFTDGRQVRLRSGWTGFAAWAFAVAMLGPLLGGSGWAQGTSIRCENKLVSPGDSAYEVRMLCGMPDATAQRIERRAIRRVVDAPCANGLGRCPYVIEEGIDVVVDEWTYDFGKQRFIQYLTFEAGKLVSLKSGDYGHKE
jgi:Protein of unknown function (DUF2845)